MTETEREQLLRDVWIVETMGIHRGGYAWSMHETEREAARRLAAFVRDKLDEADLDELQNYRSPLAERVQKRLIAAGWDRVDTLAVTNAILAETEPGDDTVPTKSS